MRGTGRHTGWDSGRGGRLFFAEDTEWGVVYTPRKRHELGHSKGKRHYMWNKMSAEATSKRRLWIIRVEEICAQWYGSHGVCGRLSGLRSRGGGCALGAGGGGGGGGEADDGAEAVAEHLGHPTQGSVSDQLYWKRGECCWEPQWRPCRASAAAGFAKPPGLLLSKTSDFRVICHSFGQHTRRPKEIRAMIRMDELLSTEAWPQRRRGGGGQA